MLLFDSIYFVVKQYPDSENYDFVGIAFDEKTAGELKEKEDRYSTFESKVLRLDLGKAIATVEKAGLCEEIYIDRT